MTYCHFSRLKNAAAKRAFTRVFILLFFTTAPLIVFSFGLTSLPKILEYTPLGIALAIFLFIIWRSKNVPTRSMISLGIINSHPQPAVHKHRQNQLRLQDLYARQQQTEKHLQDVRSQVFRIRKQLSQIEQSARNTTNNATLVTLRQSLSETLEQLETVHQRQIQTVQKIQDAQLMS